MIMTTTDSIYGRPITEYLGVISSAGYVAGAALSEKKLAQNTKMILDKVKVTLEERAAELNADAIIGLRFCTESSVLYAIGTAVKLG